MKKVLTLLMIVVFMSFMLPSPALAADGSPVGSCPYEFELHEFMEHSEPHMHHHIGLVEDLNDDGFICMLVLSEDLHLHVDNSLPLP